MSGLKVVFAGTPEFGLPSLEALYASQHEIIALYCQPDRPAGRGCKLQAPPTKTWALSHNIPVYQPLNFKSPEAIDELKALKPDVMVVIAYGLILPQSVLDIPRFGCINVHASLLPRWRGASPIQHALLHGDSQTGVTIMQMDVGMDTGNMLEKVSCVVDDTDTAQTLHDKLSVLSPAPLLKVLNTLQHEHLVPEVQQESLVTYAGKITKEHAQINWSAPAIDIDRMIRAYHPWPVAYTHVGDEVMRIHQAEVLTTSTNATPGAIVSLDKFGMRVATGSTELLIQKIQFSGGKVIRIADYLNSQKNQLQVGTLLK